MSRTYRNLRPKMRLERQLKHHQYKTGKVRDGTPQYASTSCGNGTCPFCTQQLKYTINRRTPIS